MARARPIHGLKPDATVRANAQKIIATRTVEFFSFAPYLASPAYVQQLHDMRIAAKRLRYALEIFQDALDPDAAACLAMAKEFQEIAGEIHDHDVLVDMLRAHLERRAAEHARALADFAAHADDAIETVKERSRALATDEEWVAEQTAIAAAIVRTHRERGARYDALRKKWAAWRAAGLRERLEALTVDLPDDLTGGTHQRAHHAKAAPEPSPEQTAKRAAPAHKKHGEAAAKNGAHRRASGRIVTGLIRRTTKTLVGLLAVGAALALRGGGHMRFLQRR